MPSAYTHYRFGKQMLEKLPEEIQAEISRHRRLFDAGLQGADFFFYYRPWQDDDIRKLAYKYHRIKGTDFFPATVALLSGEEAQRVYLYGLLGHYALDSNCHPYVDACTDAGKCDHAELEAEYDRILLTRDKVKKPHRFHINHYLRINRQEAEHIAPLFPPVTGKQVYESFQVFYLLYAAMSSPVRNTVRKQLAKINQHNLVMHETPNEHVAGLIDEFDTLYARAEQYYPALLDSLVQFMESGTPLISEFEKPFDLIR